MQVDTRHRTLLLTTHNSFKLRAIAIIDFVSFGALQAIGHGVSRPKSSYFRSTPTNQRSSSPFPRAPPLQARGPPPSQPACSRRPPPSPLATLSAPRSHPSPIAPSSLTTCLLSRKRLRRKLNAPHTPITCTISPNGTVETLKGLRAKPPHRSSSSHTVLSCAVPRALGEGRCARTCSASSSFPATTVSLRVP